MNLSFWKPTAKDKIPPVDLAKIELKYICPQCKSIMNQVHQAYDCGCRFCFDCLDNYIKNDGKECPSCKTKLISSTLIPDVYIQRKINELIVDCIADGCDWKGSILNYKIHFYNLHEVLQSKCQYCNIELNTRDDYEKHLNKEKGDCLMQPIDCIYKSIGCCKIDNVEASNSIEKMDVITNINEINYLTRSTIESHMYLNTNYHMELLYKHLIKLKDETISKFNKLETTRLNMIVDKNKETLNSSFSNLFNNNNSNQKNNSTIDDSRFLLDRYANMNFNNQNGKINELNESIDDAVGTSVVSDSTQVVASGSINDKVLDVESIQKIQELNLKINTLENSHKSLITDLSRLFKTSEKLKNENQILQENLKEYKHMCQELHKTLTLTQVSLLTLEERLINQEKLSFNGTLLWKITNVHERIQEAKSGRQTSFYSPPFYTDRNGFKMCARIYLNGDGNGRNTHLSLFFVILRGEYDSLLRWPFRQKVTFILIDQSLSESKENIYDAFRPDPNSSSFRRPISEMNIASGLPVFCPLGKLMSAEHEYIKDNTMFIKIIVDTKDLPEI